MAHANRRRAVPVRYRPPIDPSAVQDTIAELLPAMRLPAFDAMSPPAKRPSLHQSERLSTARSPAAPPTHWAESNRRPDLDAVDQANLPHSRLAVVIEKLPDGKFSVQLDQERMVLAHLAGKLRQNRIRVLAGDRVTLELSPYDLTKGRITYRH